MRIIIFILLLSISAYAGIVSNVTTTSEDSIAIVFVVGDSLNCPVAMENGDTLYLTVFQPSGNMSFKDSMAYNDANITEVDWESDNPESQYSLKYAIADIDSHGANGTYGYILSIRDSSLHLTSCISGNFQVIDSAFSARFMALPTRSEFSDSTGILDGVEDKLGDLGILAALHLEPSYWVYYPNDGTRIKDSVVIYRIDGEDTSWVARIAFNNDNNSDIVDSLEATNVD